MLSLFCEFYKTAQSTTYLHSDLVMSADEEESLTEWGVGRSILGNPCLAVGGTLLVALAEQWQPAIIGTLLVAAALYRVQGILTKVLRVRSPEWKSNKLVPIGIHGTERVVQLVLAVLVALADLLEDRVLLVTALASASVYVILLEVIGQAAMTWERKTYSRELRLAMTRFGGMLIVGMVLHTLVYVFAVAFFCLILGLVTWLRVVRKCSSLNRTMKKMRWLFVLAYIGVVVWVASMDFKEVRSEVRSGDRSSKVWGLVWTDIGVVPWKWPLTLAADSVSVFRVLRVTCLWIGVVVLSSGWIMFAVGFFAACSVSHHSTKPRGEKTQARKEKGIFSHYHELNIPSRNLLVSSVLVPYAAV